MSRLLWLCKQCLWVLQDVREDTSLMTDDDDDDEEMEDLDALATGLDRGQAAPLPKPAPDTGHTSLCL